MKTVEAAMSQCPNEAQGLGRGPQGKAAARRDLPVGDYTSNPSCVFETRLSQVSSSGGEYREYERVQRPKHVY